jgi:hypothetical protein
MITTPLMKNKRKSKVSFAKTKTTKLLSKIKKDKSQKTTVVYKVAEPEKIKNVTRIKKVKPVDAKVESSKTDVIDVPIQSVVKNIEIRRDVDVEPLVNTDSDDDDTSDVLNDDDTKKVRRRGRNKKNKIYFSKATEDAIIEFNAEEDMDKRNLIYNERIKFSFNKLVENIYNTFKFTYFDSGPIEIQRETISHLVTNIHKFQAGKGKAFSYFSIVAKNYLIFHNNNNYKRFNQHVDISESPSEGSACLQTEDTHHTDVQTKEFMKLLINYWETNVTKIFSKLKDLNIAYAVIELFRNCDRIENFNKKTLYLLIREISNCKTQQITKVLNRMKCYQSQISQNYTDRGVI